MQQEGKVGKFERIKAVTLFGYADADPRSELYSEAFEVARKIAELGMEVVNGGGPGVMRAATEGAHAGNGIATVATFYPKFMEHFEGKDPLNRANKEIVMNNYVDRTLKLLELGDVYIVFNGGTGTLSEFGMAWGLAYLYLGKHKPLILYGGFWYPIMEELVDKMLIKERPKSLDVYRIATTVEQVMSFLWEFELGMRGEITERHPGDVLGEKAFLR